MKIKLLINGEDKRISIIPEDKSDKKILEFVATHATARIDVNRSYNYGGRDIDSVEIKLETLETSDDTSR